MFCFVQDGVVREHGTHSELQSMKGHYYRLIQAQRYHGDDDG
jgi:ABC-type multidrug transport system fused ATPase/permease subunit